MKGEKLILDTNIWISYFIMGRIQQLTQIKTKHQLTFYTCDQLIMELEDVLQRKRIAKRLSLPTEDYVSFHRSLCTFHSLEHSSSTQIVGTIPDPKDEFLFALAASTQATYLVTGDNPLQKVTDAPYVSIISLAEFRRMTA